MEIRPVRPEDLDDLAEIDGTIESTDYLHLERAGEGLAVSWKLEKRPLREKRIEPNRLDDDQKFTLRQVVTGADDGFALLADHDGQKVGLILAQPHPQHGTLRLIDLRVDYDFRREGLATAFLFQAITEARGKGLRAVTAETLTNNLPAAQLLSKCGFDLGGVDAQRRSNHDLVKEAASLLWYVALD